MLRLNVGGVMRVVMKFGGTSVGSAEAMRRVVEIVQQEAQRHEVVVVVSAMNAPDLRTTDTLIAAARDATAGNGAAFADIAPRLLKLHMDAAQVLATPEECAALEPQLEGLFSYISNLGQ